MSGSRRSNGAGNGLHRVNAQPLGDQLAAMGARLEDLTERRIKASAGEEADMWREVRKQLLALLQEVTELAARVDRLEAAAGLSEPPDLHLVRP